MKRETDIRERGDQHGLEESSKLVEEVRVKDSVEEVKLSSPKVDPLHILS